MHTIFSVTGYKGTNKRAKSKRKTRFSFHFRAKVPSRRSLKDSANRAKYKTKKGFFVFISEMQPIFNVVKGTTFLKFFYIQSKKI